MEVEADPPFHTYGADGDGEDVNAILRAIHVNVDPRVTAIPEGFFQSHSNLKEFICHDNVHTIHGLAFSECRSLGRVVMRGVRVVERGAFFRCTALEEAVFGDQLESLGVEAFDGCTSLESINLQSVRDVERDTFSDCTALRDVTFGNQLESLGAGAFKGCTSLESVNLRSVRVVEDGAFSDCTALRDVQFGNELESLREGAFEGCESLVSITFPLREDLMTSECTWEEVFNGCDNLERINLLGVGETIAALHPEMRYAMNELIRRAPAPTAPGERNGMSMWIGQVLRDLCRFTALNELALPHAVIDATVSALLNALPPHIVNALPHAVIDATVSALLNALPPHIVNEADVIIENVLTFLKLPVIPEEIVINHVFPFLEGFESEDLLNMNRFTFTGGDVPQRVRHVHIHESVRVVRMGPFYRHRNIRQLYCLAGAIRIDAMAFHSNRSLEVAELRGVRSVGNWAFGKCTALRHAIFGNWLESLGGNAFNGCRSLERITIPLREGLFTDDNVFEGCGSLTRVDFVGEVYEQMSERIVTFCADDRYTMKLEINELNRNLVRKPAAEKAQYIGERITAILTQYRTLRQKTENSILGARVGQMHDYDFASIYAAPGNDNDDGRNDVEEDQDGEGEGEDVD